MDEPFFRRLRRHRFAHPKDWGRAIKTDALVCVVRGVVLIHRAALVGRRGFRVRARPVIFVRAIRCVILEVDTIVYTCIVVDVLVGRPRVVLVIVVIAKVHADRQIRHRGCNCSLAARRLTAATMNARGGAEETEARRHAYGRPHNSVNGERCVWLRSQLLH